MLSSLNTPVRAPWEKCLPVTVSFSERPEWRDRLLVFMFDPVILRSMYLRYLQTFERTGTPTVLLKSDWLFPSGITNREKGFQFNFSLCSKSGGSLSRISGW